MKMLLLAVFAFSLPLTLFAESTQPRHLLSVGTDGLGWSGLGTKFDWDRDKSGVKDQESSNGTLALNYSYIFETRFMIGAELFYENERIETKYDSGDEEEEKTTTTTLALSFGYNFNEDLFNSWWIKAALGGGSLNSESKDTTATPQETDTDIGVSFFQIEAGKRFSFDGIGLKNFTFSPSIVVTTAEYDEDADDAGLKKSTSVQLNVIKFDILF